MTRKKIIAYITLIFVIFVAVNLGWMALDNRLTLRTTSGKFIAAYHLYNGVDYVTLPFFPPAYLFIPKIVHHLFNLSFSYASCVYINFLYLFIAVGSIYFCSRKMQISTTSSIVAAFVYLSLPGVLFSSRWFFLEIGMIPWVILFFAMIFNEKFLKKKSDFFLLGILAGIASLFKWTSIIYLAAPLIYCSIIRKYNAKNIFFIFLGVSVIASRWYIFCLDHWFFLNEFLGHWKGSVVYEKFFSLQGLRVHFLTYMHFFLLNSLKTVRIISQEISYAYIFLLFIISFLSLKKIKQNKTLKVFYAFIYLPFAIFLLAMGDFSPRYLLPILPIIVLFFLYYIDTYLKDMKNFLLIGLIIVSLFNLHYEIYFFRPPASRIGLTSIPQLLSFMYKNAKKKDIKIAFNEIDTRKISSGEIRDITNQFIVEKINKNLPLNCVFVHSLEINNYREAGIIKFEKDFSVFMDSDFIISQDLFENKKNHEIFQKKGFIPIHSFQYYYYENSDPQSDWINERPYIIFSKFPLKDRIKT